MFCAGWFKMGILGKKGGALSTMAFQVTKEKKILDSRCRIDFLTYGEMRGKNIFLDLVFSMYVRKSLHTLIRSRCQKRVL